MATLYREEDFNVNHQFVRKALPDHFFKVPARYYLSFGITNKVHALLKQSFVGVKWADNSMESGFTSPHIYFMRSDVEVTKKGIIIELPKPFFDGDYNYVLLMYVGFKYYYIVSKYDYRNHTFSIYQLVETDNGYKEKYLNIPVDSPQDLWNKCSKNSDFSPF